MSCGVCDVTESLENEQSSFTYIAAHSPPLLSLYLRDSSFSNPSIASHMSQLILQPFFCFSYVTGSSFTLPGESSFSNISITSPTSELILQPFRRFTYVTAHSPTFPLFHLRHSSFSNPSVNLPTSQLILIYIFIICVKFMISISRKWWILRFHYHGSLRGNSVL